MPNPIRPFGDLPEFCNKVEIEELATVDAERLMMSGRDPREVYLELRQYQAYLDGIAGALKDAIAGSDDAEPYSFGNARMTYQSRVTYRYADDLNLERLKEQENHVREATKKHQAFLRSIETEHVDVVDEDSGEVVRYFAPEKEETRVVMVRL